MLCFDATPPYRIALLITPDAVIIFIAAMLTMLPFSAADADLFSLTPPHALEIFFATPLPRRRFDDCLYAMPRHISPFSPDACR